MRLCMRNLRNARQMRASYELHNEEGAMDASFPSNFANASSMKRDDLQGSLKAVTKTMRNLLESTTNSLGSVVQREMHVSDHFLPRLRVAPSSLTKSEYSLAKFEVPHSDRALGLRSSKEWVSRLRERGGMGRSDQTSSKTNGPGSRQAVNRKGISVTGSRITQESYGSVRKKSQHEGSETSTDHTTSRNTFSDSGHLPGHTRHRGNTKNATVHFAQKDESMTSSSLALPSLNKPSTAVSRTTTSESNTATVLEKEVKSLFTSVASLGSLVDHHHTTNSTNCLTSLPSLPLIQSNSVLNSAASPSLSTKTSSRISCGLAQQDLADSHDETNKKKKSSSAKERDDCQCSVINLRIPFGKVEEWDVPQKKLPMGHKLDYNKHKSSETSISDGTHREQATMRKLEFIVFSDLPKAPLPSTSSLVASVMQSNHHSHQFPKYESAGSLPPSWPPQTAPSLSQTHNSSAGGTGEEVKDSSFKSLKPTTDSDSVFMPHGLPHTLCFRHLVPQQRRASLPSGLLQPSFERDSNPSMCISSYPSYHQGSISHNLLQTQRKSKYPSADTKHPTPNTMNCDDESQSGSTEGFNSTTLQKRGRLLTGVELKGSTGCNGRRKSMKRKNSDYRDFDYPDPLADCSSRFHHRLLRMAALVSDTLIHENSKKRHKKQH